MSATGLKVVPEMPLPTTLYLEGLANDSQLNVLKSAYTRNRNIKDEKILCDYWLDDGSFLKIDAINLGYTFNLRKWTRYIQWVKGRQSTA